MILRKRWLLICLITIPYLTNAQRAVKKLDNRLEEAWTIGEDQPQEGIRIADSIRKVAINLNLNHTGLNTLNALSYFELGLGHYDRSIAYAKRGLKQIDQYHIKDKKGIFYNATGLAYFSRGNYSAASEQYNMAANEFNKSGQKSFLATAYANIGMAKRKLSKFKEANTQYFKSANIYNTLKDTLNLAGIYHSIGNVFGAWDRYDSAKEYYRKGLALAIQIKDQSLLAQSYNNIGYAQLQLGEIDSAITSLEKALHIRKNQNERSRVLLLQNLSQAWLKKGQRAKAESYLSESLKIAHAHQLSDELLRGKIDQASILFDKGQYLMALKASASADSLAKKLNSHDLRLNVLELRSKILQRQKKYEAAFQTEEQIKNLKAKIFSQNENRTIREMEAKFQSSQRELKIKSLEKEQQLKERLISGQKKYILSLIAASIILASLLIMAIRFYLDKRKAAKKIDILNEEIHHRVKNNLQTLSALLNIQASKAADDQIKNNIRENEMRLAAMNLIHQQLYQTRHNSLIQLDEFLKKLAQNINSSFGKSHTNLNLNLARIEIDADRAVSIGLLANEVLTNAFKYAKSDPTLIITIELEQLSQQIKLKIADNGKGFDINETKEKKSFGLQLIKMMSAQLSSDMQFNADQGSAYTFIIPESTS